MQGVWGSEHEDDPVEKRLEPGRRLAIWQRDDDYISGGWVNQGQGFGLTRECLALALEVHAPPRSGCVGGQGREQTVGSVLSCLVDFACRAILQPLSNVTFLRRPKVRATEQSMHFGMGQVEHAFMGVADEDFLAGMGHNNSRGRIGGGTNPKVLFKGLLFNCF